MYRRGIAAGLTCLALAGGLSGCFNGYQAQTTAQAEGGDVASANVGDVSARGLIWVRDPADKSKAYLSGTFLVADGGQPDELTKITTVPEGTVAITGAPLALEVNSPVQVGYNSDKSATVTGITLEPSQFISTTLVFKNAGSTTVSVLVVPPEGKYAKVAGGAAGASPEASTSASPEASTSAESQSPSPAAS
ncbi:MAG: hypothetical protein E6Q93_20810 [Burkholderiaceae bacterium]|nr:MAG: hypothetical protein E6Q93_20810 [Burkholderiaceae bacterium]